jgi:hypothetical protein
VGECVCKVGDTTFSRKPILISMMTNLALKEMFL